jgi:hypothetical protein
MKYWKLGWRWKGDDRAREKKIVMNFNRTPRNGKNRGVIYESTIDSRFNKSFETFLLRYGN